MLQKDDPNAAFALGLAFAADAESLSPIGFEKLSPVKGLIGPQVNSLRDAALGAAVQLNRKDAFHIEYFYTRAEFTNRYSFCCSHHCSISEMSGFGRMNQISQMSGTGATEPFLVPQIH